jgi:adenosylhomocysteine nucleosidase
LGADFGRESHSPVVVLISANAEWHAVCSFFPAAELHSSPVGEWFHAYVNPAVSGFEQEQKSLSGRVIFFHGGWGKIAAAASTQYVIDTLSPLLLINLGTCGGFEGLIERGEIVMAERTIVYDIIEQMGDYDEHIAHYSTSIDLSWIHEPPNQVRRTLLVSGDRDLLVGEIAMLHAKYGAVAGDWESGAIAWVARLNHTPVLILRYVTDLVGSSGGEAYGNLELFTQQTAAGMRELIDSLPAWLEIARRSLKKNF